MPFYESCACCVNRLTDFDEFGLACEHDASCVCYLNEGYASMLVSMLVVLMDTQIATRIKQGYSPDTTITFLAYSHRLMGPSCMPEEPMITSYTIMDKSFRIEYIRVNYNCRTTLCFFNVSKYEFHFGNKLASRRVMILTRTSLFSD